MGDAAARAASVVCFSVRRDWKRATRGRAALAPSAVLGDGPAVAVAASEGAVASVETRKSPIRWQEMPRSTASWMAIGMRRLWDICSHVAHTHHPPPPPLKRHRVDGNHQPCG